MGEKKGIYVHNLGTTPFKFLFEKISNVVFYMKRNYYGLMYKEKCCCILGH
jgi:hypothetical protein